MSEWCTQKLFLSSFTALHRYLQTSFKTHNLTQCVSSAGPYTGAALNPARVLGPSLVFNCFWNTAFLYMTGQLLGGLLAAALVLPLYGFGQFGSLFDTRVLSWIGMHVPQRFQQVSNSLCW